MVINSVWFGDNYLTSAAAALFLGFFPHRLCISLFNPTWVTPLPIHALSAPLFP